MTGQVLSQPWMKEKHLTRVIKALGGNVRFIGGCVRDAMLGREIKDVDMATPLLPEIVIKKLEKANIKVIPTGIAHGTVTALVDSIPIEITTLRSDQSCDGRHAEVRFTESWEEDAARRDFTINAMSCAPDGTLNDYQNGFNDIMHRKLRFIGDAASRCREDYLRILRYFRFFATLGISDMDYEALSACKQEAKGIDTLSGERIQHEMLRLLKADSIFIALKLMQHSLVLDHILPVSVKNIDAMATLDAIEKAVAGERDALLRLAFILKISAATAQDVDTLIARWKLSNKDAAYLKKLTHPIFTFSLSADAWEQKHSLRHHGTTYYSHVLLLDWAEHYEGGNNKQYLELLKHAYSWEIPTFPLQGKDLLAKGIKPGKELGELLAKAEAHWEETHYQLDKHALLSWLVNQ